MDVDKLRKILGYTLMGLILLSTILVFSYLKKAGACDLNPFVYGAEKTYDQGMEIFCTCSSLSGEYSPFTYDRHGVSVRSSYQVNSGEIDWSDVAVSES